MNEQQLREAMRRRFEAMTQSEWCRLTGCKNSHVSEFLNGKRGPPRDMLNALNMEVQYVKRRAAAIRALTGKDGQ